MDRGAIRNSLVRVQRAIQGVAFCELLKNPSSFSLTLGTRVDPPTNTISSTSFASTFASLRTRFTDLMERSNNGSHRLSNFDRVMSRAKSSPLYKASTSILVLVAADSSRFAVPREAR